MDQARQEIHLLFKKLHHGDYNVQQTAEHLPEIKEALETVLLDLYIEEARLPQDLRPSYKVGAFDHWESDLDRISDRWATTYRIEWLLGLINFLEKGKQWKKN
jgi:hypothetical protein